MRLPVEKLPFVHPDYFQCLVPLVFEADVVGVQGTEDLVLGIGEIEPVLVETHAIANGIVPSRIVALVLHVPAHATLDESYLEGKKLNKKNLKRAKGSL